MNLSTNVFISEKCILLMLKGFRISMVTTRDMGRSSQLSGKHPLNGAAVCVACSRHLLGKFKLTPVQFGESFVCAFASGEWLKQSKTLPVLRSICSFRLSQVIKLLRQILQSLFCFAVRESTIKDLGSLGLFHGGHLDLSTYEAKWSVKYWQTRIDVDMNDLAKMKRAHTELMTIVQGKPRTESVKLMVYRNGDARVLAPRLCVGSSMSGVR
ncbi:uncharacterized protein DEA37_0011600 [Paragonimus westermani]|uniref:Uncharacterized protein n=1 Tax=Paragonimus westermani TaxID=34504 RepID=A0A5J4P1W4_9TREM|nr:uncharacterized protein DEA37_0011600 [Paragonimus westermani]